MNSLIKKINDRIEILPHTTPHQAFVVGVGITLAAFAYNYYEISVTNSLKSIFEYTVVQPIHLVLSKERICRIMNFVSITKALTISSSIMGFLMYPSWDLSDFKKIPSLLLLMKKLNCYFVILGIGFAYHIPSIINAIRDIVDFARFYPFVTLGIGIIGSISTVFLGTIFLLVLESISFYCGTYLEKNKKYQNPIFPAILGTAAMPVIYFISASLIYLMLARNSVSAWSCNLE